MGVADDHPPWVVREQGPLGVEESERLIRADRGEEGLERRQLVGPVLHPNGVEFQVWLACQVGVESQPVSEVQFGGGRGHGAHVGVGGRGVRGGAGAR